MYAVSEINAQAVKKSQMGVALAGASFGVDFNPTVDGLRVVSDTGQNLRVNVDNGMTNVDTALSSVGVDWGRLHQQRRRPEHRHDTVRPRRRARPGRRPSRRPTRACWRRRASSASTPARLSGSTSTARSATDDHERACLRLVNVGGIARFYQINLLQGRVAVAGAFYSVTQVTGIAVKLDQG